MRYFAEGEGVLALPGIVFFILKPNGEYSFGEGAAFGWGPHVGSGGV